MSVIRRDKGVRRKRPVLADPQTSQVVGELTDDLEFINSRIEPLLRKTVRNQTYTEPMQLALPYRPEGIVLVRLIQARSPSGQPWPGVRVGQPETRGRAGGALVAVRRRRAAHGPRSTASAGRSPARRG